MKVKKLLTIGFPVVLATTAIAGASVTLVSCSDKNEDTTYKLDTTNTNKIVTAITAAAGNDANTTKAGLETAIKDGLNKTDAMGNIVKTVDVTFDPALDTITSSQTAKIATVKITLNDGNVFDGAPTGNVWVIGESKKTVTYTPAEAIESKVVGTKEEETPNESTTVAAFDQAKANAFVSSINKAVALNGSKTVAEAQSEITTAIVASALNSAFSIETITAANIESVTITTGSIAIKATEGTTFTATTSDITTDSDVTGIALKVADNTITLTKTGMFKDAEAPAVEEITVSAEGLNALKGQKFNLITQAGLQKFYTSYTEQFKEDVAKILDNDGSTITAAKIGTITFGATNITIAPAAGIKFVGQDPVVAASAVEVTVADGNIKVTNITYATAKDISENAKNIATAVKTAVTSVDGTLTVAQANAALGKAKATIQGKIAENSGAGLEINSIVATTDKITITLIQYTAGLTASPIDVSAEITTDATLAIPQCNEIVISKTGMFKTTPTLTLKTSAEITAKDNTASNTVSSGATSTVSISDNVVTITTSKQANNYVEVTLPSTSLENVFNSASDVTLSNSSIDWSIKTGSPNFANWSISSGKLVNSKVITASTNKKVILVATIKDSSGNITATAEITFNFTLGAQ